MSAGGPRSEPEPLTGDSHAEREARLRAYIVAHPDLILGDPDIMRALLETGDERDRQIVDLRGAALERLERRFKRLTQAHRDVVDAAWDNLVGMDRARRATLSLIELDSFQEVVDYVIGEAPALLSVDAVRLVFDPPQRARGQVDLLLSQLPPSRSGAGERCFRAPSPGMVPGMAARHALADRNGSEPSVRFSSDVAAEPAIFGEDAPRLRSMALVRLDFGARFGAGLLAFGAEDPVRFHESHSVDSITFLGAVLERLLGRHLSAPRRRRPVVVR